MSTAYDRLPGLNYTADLNSEDFQFLGELYEAQLMQQLRLAFGGEAGSVLLSNKYGIVSPTNPQLENCPYLMPVQDSADPLAYNITPGALVSPRGQIAIITSSVRVTIPPAPGSSYVILFTYQTTDSDYRTNSELDRLPARRVIMDDASLFSVMELNAYLAMVADPLKLSQNKSIVVVGVVAVLTAADLSTTSVLVTRATSYSFNRPWFSMVDTEHRGRVGGGIVTDSNPHGTTLEDIDTGAVGLFSQLNTEGMVIAKDYQGAGFAGTYTEEIIDAEDRWGGSGIWTLSRLPFTLGPLVGADGVEYPYRRSLANPMQIQLPYFVAQTFPPPGAYPMVLKTMVVDSLEPSANPDGVSIHVHAPGEWESVVSEGRIVRSMKSQDVVLSDMGPLGVPWEIFIDGSGAAIRTPFTVLCQGKLGTDYLTNQEIAVPLNPTLAFIPRIILYDASVKVGAVVTLRGLDVNGNTQTESLRVVRDPADPVPVFPVSDTIGAREPYTDAPYSGALTFPSSPSTKFLANLLPPEFSKSRRLFTDSLSWGYVSNSAKVWSKLISVQVAPLNETTSTTSFSNGNFTANTSLTILGYLDTRSLARAASGSFVPPPSGVGINFDAGREYRDVRASLVSSRNATYLLQKAVDDLSVSLISYWSGFPVSKVFLVEDFTSPKYGNPLISNLRADKLYYRSRFITLKGVWKADNETTYNGALHFLPVGCTSGKARVTLAYFGTSLNTFEYDSPVTLNLDFPCGPTPLLINSTASRVFVGVLVEVFASGLNSPPTSTPGWVLSVSDMSGSLVPTSIPTLSSVAPNAGPISGGTVVSITGTNFVSGMIVTFGGVPSPQVTYISPTLIHAVTPAHAAATGDVVVSVYGGVSVTSAGAFTFVPPDTYPTPTVTSIAPASGPVSGETQFTLTGTNFQPGVTVTFGANTAALIGVSPTAIIGTTPAGVAGILSVLVTNPDGQTVPLVNGFTYTP